MVAASSKAWVCGRSLAGVVGYHFAESMSVCLSVVTVVCCQLEVSATGRSVIQSSPTECVNVCVCEWCVCVYVSGVCV